VMSPADDRPPRVGRSLLVRALLGAVVIFLLTAGASATAGLLQIKNLTDKIINAAPAIKTPEITPAQAGKAQTILMLGSDRRFSDIKLKDRGRSDTLMLVRLDPHQQATSVMSIPRDLKVLIPGHGIDKINAAYEAGGEDLTLKTLKALLNIKINHVINVNFSGFRKAVDALGCVYVDIDRRYYHSNAGLPPSAQYAEINIEPGYQQLCGQRALDYVRFRHADSDIVRAARQQDFLRAAKDQISGSSIINKRGDLIDIFAKATKVDTGLRSIGGLERLLKLALFSAGHPVREIKFPAQFAADANSQYVTASQTAIQSTVQHFLHPPAAPKKKTGGGGSKGNQTTKPKKTKLQQERATLAMIAKANLVNSRKAGESEVATAVAQHKVSFPVYFPTLATNQARFTTTAPHPRIYTIRDRAGNPHRAYRLVLIQNEIEGQYYGVQGTTWRTPPVLHRPTSTRDIQGRHLLLFRDGDRLRYVGWRTTHAVYWVTNSLSLALTNAQMLGIARSLRAFHAGR
jgi:LCP family protein required for cell wall assembly